MKKLILAVAACLSLAACTQTELGSEPQGNQNKEVHVHAEGRLYRPVETRHPRGYLSADGKDLTDVWVLGLDADGNLLQQLHQQTRRLTTSAAR